MQFRTIIPAPEFPFHIEETDSVMLVGSCFSDNINPISIDRAIRYMLQPDLFDKNRYFYKYRDLWVSFAHHGRFSKENFEEFESNIDENLERCADFLRKTRYLFITFGTAFCYKFIPRDLIVSNCHKIPNHQFERLRLDVKKIVSQWNSTLALLKEACPEMKVIFTVSPVRHLGDGAHENALSKSVLLLSVEKLVDNEFTFYFPAYEYLMDDLRDYRFYAKDLCHPNDMAVSYLEEKLAESFFTEETRARMAEIERENRFLNHRKFR